MTQPRKSVRQQEAFLTLKRRDATPMPVWPITIETVPTVAAPGICWRGRRGYAESRYASYGKYLWRDVAEEVRENERHHRHAPHQERSNTFAEDHCHGTLRKPSFTLL